MGMWRCALVVAVLMAGCGDDGGGDDGPVRVAMLAPSTGPLMGVGQSFERVAQVAVDNINEQGGIDGRDLELVIEDTMADPDEAAMILDRLVDEGVVAAVGPATSGEVDMAWPVAAEREISIISPSSTAPFLSRTDIDDDGYMFRNVPDDEKQGLAIAYYLYTVSGVTSAAVLFEGTDYGRGLKDAFKVAFENLGGTVSDEVEFTQGLADVAAADAVIADLASVDPDPTMVITIALEQDAIYLTQSWDLGGPTIAGMEFFLTDGARSQGFLDGAPDSVVGMCGTAPTYPVNGLAYETLEDAYEAAHPDALEAQVYAPNVWDGFHLIAAALVKQSVDFPGEALGGAHLRDAITEVSKDPGQQFTASDWRNIIINLRDGNDIDYDGAAGPNNFDVVGQAVGPYEVWCVGENRASFTQELFLDATDLEELQQ
jgi:ABC-type branched-subunit amino acid transport system substrate-binding protein